MRYNLAVKPGSTKINKTGTWRTFRPIFDAEKCIGCDICNLVCPEGICAPTGKKNSRGKIYYETRYEFCKGCGICAEECPVKAIEMQFEEK